MRALLALLVQLFPASFRKQFGSDLVEQVQVDYDRALAGGRLRAWGFALATALDLVRSGVAERWNPTWVETRTHSISERGVGGMGGMIEGWTKDLAHAARALRRAPGFTLVAVGTLGLAIGVNTGVFSMVDAILLNPLPFPDADRLVYIAASAPGSDRPGEFGVGQEFYVQYREQADLLEGIATYNAFTATLRAGDRVERLSMSFVTQGLFSTLDVTPVLGRLPEPEDESTVAVISHTLWATWFGSDPDVIGQSYEMAGDSRTVIGVMGPEFRFPSSRTVLWVPFEITAEDVVPGRFFAPLVARVAPGVEREELADQLRTLALRLPERFGGSASYARLIEQHRPVVRPLKDELVGPVAGPLWVLLGAVGVVLLIACANVANLFTVRTESRQRDLAVRRAIGARRGQLVRSQMAEAVLLAGLAATLAVFLAWVGVPVLLSAAPAGLPRIDEVSLSASTLLFAAGASVFAALVCGLVPAVLSSAPELTRLREGGRGSTRRRKWGRDALVVAQTALALVLLVGSGLLVRSFSELRNVDPGYDTEDIFTFQIAPEGDFLDGPWFAQFHLNFMDRVAGIPGVESVGLVENVPLNESVQEARFLTGDVARDADGGTLLTVTWTGGDYFGTMGIELLRGRAFTRADHASELDNAIVSRSAADRLWPGDDPIGRPLQPRGSETWATVVGVVEDIKQLDFRDDAEPLVYFPLAGQLAPLRGERGAAISSPAYVIKTSQADQIGTEVRALVRVVAPEAPMYRAYTMQTLADNSMIRLRLTMFTLGIASVLALILGAIGLYGVLSYVVAERTQEIGVRMALGAKAKQIQRMVVAQGVRVVILGVIIGVVVAGGTTRALGSLLFGIQPLDAATFLAMSTAMLAIGLLASYLPARRASNVDPIESLRNE